MRKGQYYQYFVEGECEEKLINILKTDLQLIEPGKVQKFNVIEERLSKPRLMSLRRGTVIVLVFDTDTGNMSILQENIEFLKRSGLEVNVMCITQIRNLEDELVRSCNIKQIKELTASKSNSDFKRDFLKMNNTVSKLKECQFDIGKFWSEKPVNEYQNIQNDAWKIKLKNLH